MNKKVLIINSFLNTSQFLVDLLEELSQLDYSFYLLSSTSGIYNKFKQNKWLARKIYLGPNLIRAKYWQQLFFIFFYPLAFLIYLVILVFYKYNQKIKTIICLNWNEKIIFTPLAKVLKLNIIWLEYPETDYRALNKLLLWLYKSFSQGIRIIVFNSLSKTQLKNLGVREDSIKVIQPGIKLNQFKRQETIFHTIAQVDQKRQGHKFFTIGTVTQLNKRQNMEILFQAVKKCLTVIPNLQLVVMGDERERKDLIWLAKKMEIDSLVWFVSQESYLRKWLDSFDVFVLTTPKPDLDDLVMILKAMAAKISVIAPSNLGIEDMVDEDRSGILIEMDNSETLTQEVIRLGQDKRLRVRLGQKAQERVDKDFSMSSVVKELAKLIV